MANKRKLPASKPKATTERIEVRQPIAEYILSVQDKKFTQIQINQLLKIYESVCLYSLALDLHMKSNCMSTLLPLQTEPSDFVRQFLEVFQVVICEDLKSKRADNILSFYLAFMMALEGDETHLLWEEFFNWILNVSIIPLTSTHPCNIFSPKTSALSRTAQEYADTRPNPHVPVH